MRKTMIAVLSVAVVALFAISCLATSVSAAEADETSSSYLLTVKLDDQEINKKVVDLLKDEEKGMGMKGDILAVPLEYITGTGFSFVDSSFVLKSGDSQRIALGMIGEMESKDSVTSTDIFAMADVDLGASYTVKAKSDATKFSLLGNLTNSGIGGEGESKINIANLLGSVFVISNKNAFNDFDVKIVKDETYDVELNLDLYAAIQLHYKGHDPLTKEQYDAGAYGYDCMDMDFQLDFALRGAFDFVMKGAAADGGDIRYSIKLDSGFKVNFSFTGKSGSSEPLGDASAPKSVEGEMKVSLGKIKMDFEYGCQAGSYDEKTKLRPSSLCNIIAGAQIKETMSMDVTYDGEDSSNITGIISEMKCNEITEEKLGELGLPEGSYILDNDYDNVMEVLNNASTELKAAPAAPEYFKPMIIGIGGAGAALVLVGAIVRRN